MLNKIEVAKRSIGRIWFGEKNIKEKPDYDYSAGSDDSRGRLPQLCWH